MRLRRFRAVPAAAIAAAAVFGVGTFAANGPAGATTNFRGVASSDAVRGLGTVPNFPVTSNVLDAGLFAAQAMLTSTNESQAYASNPHPGQGVVTLPGTLAGFGAGGVPPYPLYAGSSFPDKPDAKVGDGPFSLTAKSTDKSSEAAATSGVSGDNSIAAGASTASVKQADDGGVVAKSEARLEGFKVRGVRIGSLVSQATAELQPDGTLKRSSNLDVAALTVNDTAVRLTPKGLAAGDQTVPVDLKAVNEALGKAGMSLSYIAPEETPNGILGAAVRVTSAVEVPGSGVVNVSWVLGRSLAMIDASNTGDNLNVDVPADVGKPAEGGAAPAPDTGAPPAATAAGSETPSADAGSLASAAAGDGLTAPSGSTGFGGSSSADASVPSATSEAAAAGPEQAAASAPEAAPFTPTKGAAAVHDSSGFYLLLVAGAAAVLVLSQGLRLFGVRSR
jgi:hypothetical protein